jgi:SAM-dependent methyltransferase
MKDKTLSERQIRWQEKPVLRLVYGDLYARLATACLPGQTLEIGGGSGNIKGSLPNVITTDILPVPWVDLLADAQNLPFCAESFDNIIMFDVLHHIEQPSRFFSQAENVLRPGGRIVMVEPYITPLSWIFYSMLHPEPVKMQEDPWQEKELDPDKDPFDGNQAIPTLIFQKQPERFTAQFPQLQIKGVQPLSLFVYPLSGGYQPWCLIPIAVAKFMLKVENLLLPFLGRFMGFRMLIILEKK